MFHYWRCILTMFLTAGACPALADSNALPLVELRWFEMRTAHFNIYSCGNPRDVYALAMSLEQFSDAYTLLGGAKQVASPPIIVMAFPDQESVKPFLPLYQGQPGNVSGFFKRGSDENLIVLALPGTNSISTAMDIIFHEYAHLLFRRNAWIWPLWLSEGMAEIYSTFESDGRNVLIARPIAHHLSLLAREPLWPLAELFAVTPDSSQYNERERQGMFYAESWLLTHFLTAGDIPAYKMRFQQFTPLLRQGQVPEQAFTNALQTALPVMDAELARYLQRGRFAPIRLLLPANVASATALNSREITPVETFFLLGNELLRIDRLNEAESYFRQAQRRAPASPLPYEGLALLAARREKHAEALSELEEALTRGSISFLAHYLHAQEKYRLTADSQGGYSPLKQQELAALRGELRKSIALMPNFAPAHQLLGFLEMVQCEDLALAEQELQLAIQLEPDNPSYLLSLAQVQLRNKNAAAARRTLEPLLLPNVESTLRAHAREMLEEIGRERPGP